MQPVLGAYLGQDCHHFDLPDGKACCTIKQLTQHETINERAKEHKDLCGKHKTEEEPWIEKREITNVEILV